MNLPPVNTQPSSTYIVPILPVTPPSSPNTFKYGSSNTLTTGFMMLLQHPYLRERLPRTYKPTPTPHIYWFILQPDST